MKTPSLAVLYLMGGGAVALAAAAGLLGSAEGTACVVLGAATLISLAASTAIRRPLRAWSWITMILALSLFLVDGVLRCGLHTLGDLSVHRSLVPDMIAMPGYVLLGLSLLGFSGGTAKGEHSNYHVVLDGLIAALAIAAVAWVFAVQPMLVGTHAPLPVKVVLTAYPPASIFLIVVTWRNAFSPGRTRVFAYWCMLGAMCAMFCGDALYMFADSDMLEIPQRLLDLPYSLAFLQCGAMALHPTMRALTEPYDSRQVRTSRLRIVLVAVALLIPALLCVQRSDSTPVDRLLLSLCVAALSGLVILRLIQALRSAEASQERLMFRTLHDDLTGLPNRRFIEQHLAQILDHESVDDTHVALLYLDLDRFKLVNDLHGHGYGDDLLVTVADRLRSRLRPTDVVARIGGDEFIVVLDRLVSVSQAVELANRLHSCLREPFIVNNSEIRVSASIGLAFASGDDPTASAEALVRDADTAMYQAKDAGRDMVAVFDTTMHERVAERVELENDMRSAIENNEFRLVYQPILDLNKDVVVGVEALLRWTHPMLGVVPPAKFIPLAEETGRIVEIGRWVLEEAVRQHAAWCRQWARMRNLYVSVNLSGVQLFDDGILALVSDTLAMEGLDASSLCLELTESAVMQDPDAAASILQRLRMLGVRVAIDDFGSEYSSLAYLKRFPASMLKIDKSFVDTIADAESADAALIASMVAMAQAFGITTVAEGVETEGQAVRLRELGCDAVQGFLYAAPVEAESVPEVVNSLGSHRLRLVSA